MMKKVLVKCKKSDKLPSRLTVQRVEPSVWTSLEFHKYHYLTSSLNKSCKCFMFRWNGNICGFFAILNSPRKGIPWGFAGSRLVVLPDYQGLGLSSKMMSFIGGIIRNESDEHHLYIKTIHDLMGTYFTRSEKWRPTAFNGKARTKSSTECEQGKYNNRFMRTSYCFEYIGENIDGYQELLLPIKELRDKKKNKKKDD